MPKPSTILEWANDNIAEYTTNPEGDVVLVLNKETPSIQTQSSGVRTRSPLARPYYNYMINSLCQHTKYQYEGEIGDVFIVNDSSGTSAIDIQTRFGNTWVDRGTETLFGQTLRMFERTA